MIAAFFGLRSAVRPVGEPVRRGDTLAPEVGSGDVAPDLMGQNMWQLLRRGGQFVDVRAVFVFEPGVVGRLTRAS